MGSEEKTPAAGLKVVGVGINTAMADEKARWYETGQGVGHAAGYFKGHAEGFDEGHAAGYETGYQKGHEEGFAEGHLEGVREVLDALEPALKRAMEEGLSTHTREAGAYTYDEGFDSGMSRAFDVVQAALDRFRS